MIFDDIQILEATRNIRLHIPRLLDDTEITQQIDLQLTQILNQTDLEEKEKAGRLWDILDSHPATKIWIENYLSGLKGFDRLPGDSRLQPAIKHICPIGDDCTWYQEDGSKIPLCPTHLVSLIPAQP
jgi:hypothetical protein